MRVDIKMSQSSVTHLTCSLLHIGFSLICLTVNEGHKAWGVAWGPATEIEADEFTIQIRGDQTRSINQDCFSHELLKTWA